MFINLVLHCNKVSGVSEARVLLDAIQNYIDEIREAGFAQYQGDGPATLSVLLGISMQLNSLLLAEVTSIEENNASTETGAAPGYVVTPGETGINREFLGQ